MASEGGDERPGYLIRTAHQLLVAEPHHGTIERGQQRIPSAIGTPRPRVGMEGIAVRLDHHSILDEEIDTADACEPDLGDGPKTKVDDDQSRQSFETGLRPRVGKGRDRGAADRVVLNVDKVGLV